MNTPRPLKTKITCCCERIRRNNGIIEILFSNRSGNGGAMQEEHGLFNLITDRGEPEVGAFYEISIRPVNE